MLEYQGKTWHIGFKAYEYRKTYHFVEGDLSKEVLLAMLACCEFPAKEFKLTVRTSHPTPSLAADSIKSRLQGCHRFSRNGHHCIVHVEDVTVEPEGLGAWRYAKKQGLIPDQGYTVVIDIGGGTWLSRLFNPSGDIIDQSVDERGGGYDLATSISFDDRYKTRSGSAGTYTKVFPGVKSLLGMPGSSRTWLKKPSSRLICGSKPISS